MSPRNWPLDLQSRRALEACAAHFSSPVSRGCLACKGGMWPVPDVVREHFTWIGEHDVVMVHERDCPAMAGRTVG